MRARQIFTGLALALAPATQADCAPTQPAIRMVVSPAALPGRSATPVIFLGGSIDNGSANNWQADLVAALSDQTAIILNPRREEWNPAWRNDAADPHFREQVEWELAGLERAEVLLDERLRLRRFDVARDDQAGIAGRVVGLEELHHIVVPGGGEVVHVADDGPVVRVPFGIEELGEAQLACCPLPSPRAEAQQVARRISDLLAAGTAPGAIALIAQSPERRRCLLEALSRYEVPVYAPPPAGLLGEPRQASLPAPLQALFGLLDTVAQGLPREGLIRAMTSRYFRFPGPLHNRPWQVARALREAGVRELRPPGPAAPAELWSRDGQGSLLAAPRPEAAGDYRQRLEQWLRQQASQQRPSRSGPPPGEPD